MIRKDSKFIEYIEELIARRLAYDEAKKIDDCIMEGYNQHHKDSKA